MRWERRAVGRRGLGPGRLYLTDLQQALITAKDLGKPWVQPKTVNRVQGKKGEICPGHGSAADKIDVTAKVSADLTEGKGVGRNIASYRLQTLPDVDTTALAAALATDQRNCARYRDAAGFSVVCTSEGPTGVSGAEVVAGWAERIYYVKPHKLAYARHYLVVHQGRVVTTLSYAFLTEKNDPKAKDFTRATRLLESQVTKNASVFH